MRLVILTLALLTVLIVSPAAAQSATYWERFDVSIEVRSNGDLLVTEDQSLRFGERARHGFREIPLDRVEQIVDLSVSEPGPPVPPGPECIPGGAIHLLQTSSDGGDLLLDWWFPATAGASRTFSIQYRVVGGLRYYEAGDQVYWQAVYADRPFPVQSSQVTVNLPQDIAPSDLQAAGYPENLVSHDQVDPRTVRFSARNLPAGTGLVARVQFPHGIVSGSPPAWQAAADLRDQYDDNVRPIVNLFLGALGLLIAIGGSLWAFIGWAARGRDPLVGRVAGTLSEPPSALPPALAGTLVDERADVQDVVATLVDLARRGVIRIVEERGRLGGRDFEMELLKDGSQDLRDTERLLVGAIFQGEQTVRFSEVGSDFQAAIPEIQRRLHEEVAREGLFRENPEAVRRRNAGAGMAMLILGVGLALVLPALAGEWADLLWVPFIGLAVAGGARLAFSRAMPRRTQVGSLEAARWRAFARHLAEREPQQPVAAEKELFEPYLPYAIALGVDRQWVRKFSEAGTPGSAMVRSLGAAGDHPRRTGLWARVGRLGRGGPTWGGNTAPDPDYEEEEETEPRGRRGRQRSRGGDLQDVSDSLADMLNSASRSLARGGRGGWSGGGGGGRFGGGGGGGGRGGFN